MEIFKLFGSILIDSSEAEASISKTGEKAEGIASKLGSGIKTAAKWGAAIAAGAAAAGAAIMGVATKSAAAADNVDKMSQKIGISREAYQELSFACSQSGTDVDTLKSGVKTLTNQMQMAADGNKTAAAAFDSLGLSIYDVNGNLKSQEDMMFETMSALQGMDDQTQKAALAVDLFGKSGSELMPMLNGAAGSIDAMRQQAHDLGLVMSDDAVDAGVKFTDTMDQLKRAFSAVAVNVGVELMPLIMELAAWITANMPVIQDVASAAFGAISTAVGAFVGWIKSAIEMIQQWAADNQKTIERVQLLFQKFFSFVESLFAVFSDILSGDWDHLFSETLPNLLKGAFELIDHLLELALDGLVVIVKGVGTAMFQAGKSLFSALWDGIKSIWDSIGNWVSDKVSWLTDKLTFWRSGSREMDSGKISGSHAAGLPFVPYDGYVAQLHRGETVLSADGTKEMIAGVVREVVGAMVGGEQQPQTIVVQSVLDGKIIGETAYQYNRNRQRAYGG